MKDYIVIMAGGSGTRMKSNVPKQLLDIGRHPMMVHLLEKASYLNKEVILIVSKANHDQIISNLLDMKYITLSVSDDDNSKYIYKNIIINIVIQPIANGTGGALIACNDFFNSNLDQNARILILSADVPLITIQTIRKIYDEININSTKCVILAKYTDYNFGYGRIVTKDNKFINIVEEKDCTNEQKQIKYINTGIYAFETGALIKALQMLDTNNAHFEYYLTDCPKYIQYNENNDDCIKIIETDTDIQYDETMGANTPEQLEYLREEYYKKFTIENINNLHMITDEQLINLLHCLNQLSITNISTLDLTNFDKLRNFLLSCNQNHKYMYVIKYENMIIGTGSILIEHKIIHNMGKVAHIEDIVIDEFYRGNGLARQLLEVLIDIAKYNDCYKIILNCSNDMINFYEKMGFIRQSNGMRMNIQ